MIRRFRWPHIGRRVAKVIDIACNIVLTVFGLGLLYVLLLVTVFDTCHIPTESMTPTLRPGDRRVINKLKLGGRLFDVYAAAAEQPFDVYRIPGYGRLEKGDVIVFNATFKENWDTVMMNMYRYYCKRAVAVAGDTLEVRDGFYRVSGYDGILGIEEEQRRLSAYMRQQRTITPDTAELPGWLSSMPFDKELGWTIADMGPIVIPACGMAIRLDALNYKLYRKYIVWETGQSLTWHDDCAWLGDRRVDEYVFKENYCFAAGDHVINSQDSRYWGLVPEKFIVGVIL